MEQKKGDASIRVNAQNVTDGFRAVGAIPGDTLFYHGSLSSMGTVEGGPATVTEGALAAVGQDGTVAMPTLWYKGGLNPDDFDVKTSPSNVGALSESFRTDPRSLRSNDFSHSVSAIGARAEELTAGHEHCILLNTPWSHRAFSDGSPWARLYDWNALYCFIGVSMGVCTMKHYIETHIVADCLAQAAPERRESLRSRLVSLGVRDWSAGVWPGYRSDKLGELLVARGLVSVAKIGSATLQGIRTRTLVNETRGVLCNAPRDWFSYAFQDWQEECLRKG